MTPQLIFTIFIVILVGDFIFSTTLNYLNAKNFDEQLPKELNDVYNSKEYKRSQSYKKANYGFSIINSLFGLSVILVFLFADGFAIVNGFAQSKSDNPISIALLFFGIIFLGSTLLSLPFSYYATFVIEEKFGFNKTNHKTFILDQMKSLIISSILGGGILALIIWFYYLTGKNFWFYAWAAVTLFALIMNMFYSRLIVPMFNKQTPLEQNELRTKIESYAKKVGFAIDNIFIIDGSKRSTKANAYFSGFGSEKRITLYDTLVEDLEEDEIVAVLAHEVGHYKKKHIIYNLIASTLTIGLMLWLLSLFIDSPLLSQALNIQEPSFHIGLIAFAILYSPISGITGFLMNTLSRKFEYQADDFAKATYQSKFLISSLKKLSSKSLSNLTPHKAYVFFHYAHPTLLQRIKNLRDIQ